MSDDGWDDEPMDDGDDWGDEGGNDEGWGEDDDDGWGSGDNGAAVADDQELSVEMKIENAFYEADDTRLDSSNTDLALEQFSKVLELSHDATELQDETLGYVFKSLKNIVSILVRKNRIEEMNSRYDELLDFIPRVTRNEAQEAVNTVLHDASETKDDAFVRRVYRRTADKVRGIPDQERLWYRVTMKYCEYCYGQGDMPAAKELLAELLSSCQKDGKDDLNKGAELLEIYALDSRMSVSSNDTQRLKELYGKTKDLQAAVKDPKSQSVIKECWGMMFGDQGDWTRAYAEFYSAFNSYQEIGDRLKAKQCLQYVVVANMLSGGASNPFDAREAKAFQNDPDIQVIGNLRVAYEECDTDRFNKALKDIKKSGDTFIPKHLGSMIHDFRGRAIMQIIRSYERVKLSYLAEKLQVTVDEVESLLVRLVLDRKVVGRIDQVNGLLDLTAGGVGGGAKYDALQQWVSALEHLNSAMPIPHHPSTKSGVRM